MAIYIQEVHMEPANGTGHEHIASVRWVQPGSSSTTESTREQMVTWINGGGEALVTDSRGDVRVGVVKADPPYHRTYADGRLTDNLLSLPRF
jgi:hypothetical protein